MVLSMERWKGKVAIVTGATFSIGCAITERLIFEGVKVVSLGRRMEIQESLKSYYDDKPGEFHPFKADMTKEEDILAAFKWTRENLGPVHILVNNAGVHFGGKLTEGDTSQWRETFDTNVLGLCIATREAVKDMRENQIDGHIININCVAGHIVPTMANMNVYPASKFAVTALTETLRQELNSTGSKIKITSISPEIVQSNFVHSSGLTNDPVFREFYMTSQLLYPEDVADTVAYVLSTPPHVQVHEIMMRPIGDKIPISKIKCGTFRRKHKEIDESISES